MKGLLLVFVVLVAVSMEVQAAVDSCFKDCLGERIRCLRNHDSMCHDLPSCDNCLTAFERCVQRCSTKRE